MIIFGIRQLTLDDLIFIPINELELFPRLIAIVSWFLHCQNSV